MTEKTQEKNAPATDGAVATETPTPEKLLTETLVESYEQSLDADAKKTFEKLGYALFHSVSDEKAQELLHKFGFKPRDVLDHYNAGCALAAKEKFSDAAKAFAAALDLDSNFEPARFNHALAKEMAGDAAGAKKSWKELLDLCQDEEESARIKQHLKELADS